MKRAETFSIVFSQTMGVDWVWAGVNGLSYDKALSGHSNNDEKVTVVVIILVMALGPAPVAVVLSVECISRTSSNQGGEKVMAPIRVARPILLVAVEEAGITR